ncbi:FAD-binding oxidoreductase [Alisedimentitalea sp. MJ-SS2]|uniref:NAD(P)/FAD-dependent oxidoreductase n=1 Tax=Aliisedimentitalea sp. MJ-SS2 TaxID=3049795 RepID=UPI002913B291|nr:FAD-binding oxidoreductase [Alisedimentitalea sp. MJ-SS2]MDU8928238.1 FAD-binding oxidoreductase [Alisedimentitalea sp. MJ-SS2]
MNDIIVIGGGIAGLSAAARLAPHAKVTVLESEEALGYHASGRSAAMYEAQYGLPTTIALNLASGDFHRDHKGGYLSARGILFAARAHERNIFEAENKAMKMNEVTPQEAIDLVPILNPETVAFAAFHEDAFDLDTDRMMQDFARDIRAHGGEIHLKSPVTAIDKPGKWQIHAGGQMHETKMVVNAAGAWADQVAAMAGINPLGLTPCRRSMARIPAPRGHDISNWPMFFGTGERWYAKPDAGQLIVSPAEEDPVDPMDAWADDMVLAEGFERYQEMVTEPVERVTANWAGLRTFSPDRALVLGRSVEDSSFVWSAGQGGYGFQTAPAASQLVADLALGHAPELEADLVTALSPQRFA